MKKALLCIALIAATPAQALFLDEAHTCKSYTHEGATNLRRSFGSAPTQQLNISHTASLRQDTQRQFHVVTVTLPLHAKRNLTIETIQTCCSKHLRLSIAGGTSKMKTKEYAHTFDLPQHAYLETTTARFTPPTSNSEYDNGTLEIVTIVGEPAPRRIRTVAIDTK